MLPYITFPGQKARKLTTFYYCPGGHRLVAAQDTMWPGNLMLIMLDLQIDKLRDWPVG